jgi:hypothetical protein
MRIIIFLLLLTISSCYSVEERIKDYSYTNESYYIDTMKFQVYQTKRGRKYIIVLNNRHTKFKRQYIN